MILENLKDFEWYNEPENVVFSGQEMKISAGAPTDFWQSLQHGFAKDDGHFFFKRIAGDFCSVVKWSFEKADNFNQCGIMIRIDERNWFKSSVMYQDSARPEIGSCVTNCGFSDWAGVPLPQGVEEIFYKVVRRGDDFAAFYSLDGENFIRLRQFYLINILPEIKTGAYICAPQDIDFHAVLENVDFSD